MSSDHKWVINCDNRRNLVEEIYNLVVRAVLFDGLHRTSTGTNMTVVVKSSIYIYMCVYIIVNIYVIVLYVIYTTALCSILVLVSQWQTAMGIETRSHIWRHQHYLFHIWRHWWRHTGDRDCGSHAVTLWYDKVGWLNLSHYSISQEICTRFCCALLCCGYAIVHNEFTWRIYPYSSWLLCWHWGNR